MTSNPLPGDPEGLPTEHVDRLGVILYFDTNFVDAASEAATRLRELHTDGWFTLRRTDTIDTELQDTKEPEKRETLLGASAAYPESLGPAIFGHSRFDHAVFASADDAARIDAVFAILFPGSNRRDSSTGRSRRKLRDAMHVATAIRYGATGFVTLDDDDLLAKTAEIADAFGGFRIMSPEQALAFVERMRARWEYRHRD